MDPLMQLTANEARRDRDNAIAHARRNSEPDTTPKFHVVTFQSRAKAIALREWALARGITFGMARRGAVYHDGRYTTSQVAAARKEFERWWRDTRQQIDAESAE